MISTEHSPPVDSELTIAGTLLARLANGDFEHLDDVFETDLTALAMLPGGVYEWPGHEAIRSVFEQWFGDVDEYGVTDFAVSRIGRRLHLRWRILVSGGHLGDGRYVVEQQMYADIGHTGRIASMSFLCSGFVRVGSHG
jgi:hypothetical protein